MKAIKSRITQCPTEKNNFKSKLPLVDKLKTLTYRLISKTAEDLTEAEDRSDAKIELF